MIKRRAFLTGLTAAATLYQSSIVRAANSSGAMDAVEEGLRPGTEDQGKRLQSILETASQDNKSVFIRPGTYTVSNVTLPRNVRLYGTPGATILRYGNGDHFVFTDGGAHIELDGITFDGNFMPVKDYSQANLKVTNAQRVRIENCHVTNASAHGVEIHGSRGRFSRNRVDSAIGNAGFFGLENTGLSISDNEITDCGNCGIMIYRWTKGADNTIVTNNRVERVSALKGGTGPWGNGINTYQADGVIINNNHVSDCAFSTIRSNGCNNIQISNNTCLRAGETSIYSEFEFQGANVSGNIVDGGARGISIVNLDQGGRLSVCTNNLIRNIHANAPYPDNQHLFGNGISVEADCSVANNVIENTENFGIMLGWGHYLKNVVASGNVIRRTKTGIYISVVEGVGKTIISNNSLSEISRGGIVGHRWKEATTGELAGINGTEGKIELSGNQLN